jgi:hypothetical protein
MGDIAQWTIYQIGPYRSSRLSLGSVRGSRSSRLARSPGCSITCCGRARRKRRSPDLSRAQRTGRRRSSAGATEAGACLALRSSGGPAKHRRPGRLPDYIRISCRLVRMGNGRYTVFGRGDAIFVGREGSYRAPPHFFLLTADVIGRLARRALSSASGWRLGRDVRWHATNRPGLLLREGEYGQRPAYAGGSRRVSKARHD